MYAQAASTTSAGGSFTVTAVAGAESQPPFGYPTHTNGGGGGIFPPSTSSASTPAALGSARPLDDYHAGATSGFSGTASTGVRARGLDPSTPPFTSTAAATGPDGVSPLLSASGAGSPPAGMPSPMLNGSAASLNGSASQQPPAYIWVLDPMTRKLRVPVDLLIPTQASRTRGSTPSLCVNFQQGRCRASNCRQAHIYAHVVAHLRQQSESAPTCCEKHGDLHDVAFLRTKYKGIVIVASSNPSENAEVPLPFGAASPPGFAPQAAPNANGSLGGGGAHKDHGTIKLFVEASTVARTVGLARYLVHTTVDVERGPDGGDYAVVPAKHICRLHAQRKCRYVDDCNNVHICREYDLNKIFGSALGSSQSGHGGHHHHAGGGGISPVLDGQPPPPFGAPPPSGLYGTSPQPARDGRSPPLPPPFAPAISPALGGSMPTVQQHHHNIVSHHHHPGSHHHGGGGGGGGGVSPVPALSLGPAMTQTPAGHHPHHTGHHAAQQAPPPPPPPPHGMPPAYAPGQSPQLGGIPGGVARPPPPFGSSPQVGGLWNAAVAAGRQVSPGPYGGPNAPTLSPLAAGQPALPPAHSSTSHLLPAFTTAAALTGNTQHKRRRSPTMGDHSSTVDDDDPLTRIVSDLERELDSSRSTVDDEATSGSSHGGGGGPAARQHTSAPGTTGFGSTSGFGSPLGTSMIGSTPPYGVPAFAATSSYHQPPPPPPPSHLPPGYPSVPSFGSFNTSGVGGGDVPLSFEQLAAINGGAASYHLQPAPPLPPPPPFGAAQNISSGSAPPPTSSSLRNAMPPPPAYGHTQSPSLASVHPGAGTGGHQHAPPRHPSQQQQHGFGGVSPPPPGAHLPLSESPPSKQFPGSSGGGGGGSASSNSVTPPRHSMSRSSHGGGSHAGGGMHSALPPPAYGDPMAIGNGGGTGSPMPAGSSAAASPFAAAPSTTTTSSRGGGLHGQTPPESKSYVSTSPMMSGRPPMLPPNGSSSAGLLQVYPLETSQPWPSTTLGAPFTTGAGGSSFAAIAGSSHSHAVFAAASLDTSVIGAGSSITGSAHAVAVAADLRDTCADIWGSSTTVAPADSGLMPAATW